MTLRECYEQHEGRNLAKIDHFYDVYQMHFFRYRNTPVRLLEIGVHKGGSLELWQSYFGADAVIHGIDIDPSAAKAAPPGTTVHIGSQIDEDFILNILGQHGPFDIVIDDGSHMMEHQIASFKMIYPHVSPDGVYVCEDSFTSYWKEYGGEIGGPDTFMEYTKILIDELHADWALDAELSPTDFTRITKGMHIYSGTVVFERSPMPVPVYSMKVKDRVVDISIEDLKAAAARET